MRGVIISSAVVLVVAGLVLVTANSAAEIQANRTEAKQPTVGGAAVGDGAERRVTTPGGGRANVRCWQEGQLILEEPLGPGYTRPAGVQVVQLGGSKSAIVLFELGRAVCMIKGA